MSPTRTQMSLLVTVFIVAAVLVDVEAVSVNSVSSTSAYTTAPKGKYPLPHPDAQATLPQSPPSIFPVGALKPAPLAPSDLPRVPGKPPGTAPDNDGSALMFYDDGAYVVSPAPIGNFTGESLTVTAWVMTADKAYKGTIFSYFSSTLPGSIIAINDYNNLKITVGTDTFESKVSVADGLWHHIAFTWEKATGECNLFKDMLLVAAGTLAKDATIPDDGAVVLGQWQNCLGGCFDPKKGYHGVIDEFGIWNHKRTPIEMLADMNTKVLKCSPGLVLFWNMDEGKGSFANDTSPHTNDGLLGGGSHELSPDWVPGITLVRFPPPAEKEITKRVIYKVLTPECPNNCSGHGDCNRKYGRCSCYNGWTETDCSKAVGSAMYFDGSGVVYTEPLDNFPCNNFTVEFWMLSDDKTRAGTFASYSVHSDDQALILYDVADFKVYINGDSSPSMGICLNDAKWHHVHVSWESFDGRTVIMVDSQVHYKGFLSPGKSIKRNGVLVLGQHQQCLAGCFHPMHSYIGVIDDFRIWDHARIIQESWRDMFKQLTGTQKGLALYYPFDEGVGDTVVDWTFAHGEKHDAYLTAATKFGKNPKFVPGFVPPRLCPNMCSGHGLCSRGQCRCEPDWSGPSCSNSNCDHVVLNEAEVNKAVKSLHD
eukprot:GFYU01003200.1.p1 GENE.GFYU01003200.1~~GFYU01003200.1.p1  ORF type:complete len:667 (+),score=200.11 GFYU01003200.1:53-2002(+)